jgi:chromosome segregation ATPase
MAKYSSTVEYNVVTNIDTSGIVKLQNELTDQQEQLQNQQVQLQQKMQEIEEAKEMANLEIENLQQQYEQLNIDIAQLSVPNIVTYDQPFTEEELVQVVQTLKAENPHMSDGDVVSRAYAMLGSPYV